MDETSNAEIEAKAKKKNRLVKEISE